MTKKLVAYFSASGVTANAAKLLKEVLAADIYEIKPAVPYTKEDLNWMDMQSRSSLEMKDKSGRPEIVKGDIDVGEYDVVFLGFPIWWYIAPTIINTFLESQDFSGKKIVLFATSGGSDFGKTVENLKPSVAADTEICEGRILNGELSVGDIKAWTDSLDL